MSTEKMPTFTEAMLGSLPENITFTVQSFALGEFESDGSTTGEDEPKTNKKRSKTIKKEDQSAVMRNYYHANKEHRLAYKAAKRGTTRVPSNQCSIHTEYLPKRIKQEGKHSTANIDYINYGGKKTTLIIQQPTEDLIAFIKLTGSTIKETASGQEHRATSEPVLSTSVGPPVATP